MLSHDNQSIVALCTPKGGGALALIRLSGDDVFAITDLVAKLPGSKKLSTQKSHTIHYGMVIDQNQKTIDRVLFFLMRGPQTFTGQDTIEISCHNNPFIIEEIIAGTIKAGARLAEEGEFTKRAVLNNKIDLLQAEAVNELINAKSQYALQQSLAQLEGSLSQHIYKIEKNLTTALAYANASFEFLDEEQMEFGQSIQRIIETTRNDIHILLQSFNQQKQIREGIRIAFIGSVNAGKSSLFNTIIGNNRSIVTEYPGTTRDTVEASFYHNGMHWTLVDTAGIRKTKNRIEQEGVKRSLHEASKADIILLILDNSRSMFKQEVASYNHIYTTFKYKTIVILNKADLPNQAQKITDYPLKTTAFHSDTTPTIIAAITSKIEKLFQALQSPYLLTQRQHNILIQLNQKLKDIEALFGKNIAYELIAYQLNEAISHCAHISGKSVSDLAFDAIFKEFCIGK